MSVPSVGIVMGSDSDLSTVQKALDVLDQFGIDYEVRVLSAHRSPAAAHDYARTAAERGLKVIIAAAGLAAHLGGVMAGVTTLPVIGIPMAAGPLQGFDALLSTVQMPPGVPVATVAIGDAGATNAGVLAAQILSLSDATLQKKVQQYKELLERKVRKKNEALQEAMKNRPAPEGSA
jgi:phosphoribosylaminoimidazole carboxylase PurE protein